MAGSVNRVLIIGRLGQSPETKTYDSNEVVWLSVAASEHWKDKQTGERKTKTEWVKVRVYDKRSVEFAKQYLAKGDLVYVQGKLETRSWEDKDGNKRYETTVAVRPFQGELISLKSADDANAG